MQATDDLSAVRLSFANPIQIRAVAILAMWASGCPQFSRRVRQITRPLELSRATYASRTGSHDGWVSQTNKV